MAKTARHAGSSPGEISAGNHAYPGSGFGSLGEDDRTYGAETGCPAEAILPQSAVADLLAEHSCQA